MENIDLSKRARQWLLWDKDPETQREISAFQEADDIRALQQCLGSKIRFDTAGLLSQTGSEGADMGIYLTKRLYKEKNKSERNLLKKYL